MQLASALTRLEALSVGVNSYVPDTESAVSQSGDFLPSLGSLRSLQIVSFPSQVLVKADELIEGLSKLPLQSLSLMHCIMAENQNALEDLLMTRLRESPPAQNLRKLHLGLGLHGLKAFTGLEVTIRQNIEELSLDFAQDNPLIDASDMDVLDTFPHAKTPSLGITPFRDAEAGISGIDNWSQFDLAGPSFNVEILEAIVTELPNVEGLSLLMSYEESAWVGELQGYRGHSSEIAASPSAEHPCVFSNIQFTRQATGPLTPKYHHRASSRLDRDCSKIDNRSWIKAVVIWSVDGPALEELSLSKLFQTGGCALLC
ncbi:uncharacterized protein PAC_15036 [Phialocephala subalpina]|uniref:Uncharacterized protein n=1 Tax=Phialocephala subalpina TaxID=576137 RepID=A0A1L7XJL8_9HELO|nr:uncharacterized protein PAC_15036 [Phialocephala subalpina]